MRERKTEMVRAVDLREKRKAAGLTADELADILEVSDGKHVSAIEIGKCAITLQNAAKAAAKLGPITVEVEGLGLFTVTRARNKPARVVTELRPGEAAWIAVEENREAVQSIEELQQAVLAGDREKLVRIYEQVVCDPQHAASLVAASIDKIDPTIGVEARRNHARKLAAKGIVTEEENAA